MTPVAGKRAQQTPSGTKEAFPLPPHFINAPPPRVALLPALHTQELPIGPPNPQSPKTLPWQQKEIHQKP